MRATLILGSEPRIVVPVARVLARHGIPVNVAAEHPSPALRSRSIRQFVALPAPAQDPDGFCRALRAHLETGSYDFVVFTNDTLLNCIHPWHAELNRFAHLACPPPEAIRVALDKALTLAAAARCGIPTPVTYSIPSIAGAGIPGIRFPVIAKPARKT